MPKAPKTPKVPKVPDPQVPAVTVSTPEVAVTTTDTTTATTQAASLLPVVSQRTQNITLMSIGMIFMTISTGLVTTGQFVPGIAIGALGLMSIFLYEKYSL